MHMYPVNGACHRVGPTHTAFAYREARYGMVFLASWTDPSKDAERIRWSATTTRLYPRHQKAGGYINFMQDTITTRSRTTTARTTTAWSKLSGTHDPGNLFHINQNITP